MEIYLVRHTKPNIDKGICYGQADVPLSDSFEAEASQLLKQLPDKADIIYSSPLSRCHNLAKLIKGSELMLDRRLMEMNFGDWEMQNWDKIDQTQLNTWMADFVEVKVPNGENFVELHNRVSVFIDELVKQSHKTVVVTTHAGVIRSAIAKILEMPLKNAFKIPVDYSSVTKLNISGDGCYSNIEYLNKV